MNILYVFPGQGSQYEGMGRDLCEAHAIARDIYDRANDVLGYDIKDISFNNPGDELNLTRNTQPALLTHHIACLEVFRDQTADAVQPTMAAGHSLGEYSALVAANAMTFETALRLVQTRGALMGEHGQGEMTAFMLALDDIKPLAEELNCAISACNQPKQTVVGGSSADLEMLEARVADAFPRGRAIRLKTEGAFHTFYMDKAADLFREALADAEMQVPGIRVLSNYTGGFHGDDVDEIRERLYFQLKHPVMWDANLMAALGEGVDRIYEFGGGIGPGEATEKRPNLEGMIKKARRAAGSEAEYTAAINRQTIDEAASGESA
ncbi:MAG: ACP S-malonyltransferase [Chromatiales bacterium]|nr:MAG: ACP S-malonyltransferase [Chromatiales bacterium]